MNDNLTPYSNKNDQSFWKTGFADVELGKDLFESLHSKVLSKDNPRISSLGSCFAQHVGKWLQDSGYIFNQSEIEKNLVSSFAFGNIYTPRCLLQWLEIAMTGRDLDAQYSVYESDGKFYDLLRPTFNEAGFDSQEQLTQSRLDSCQEMLEILKKTDVLVFTLGLTEAWKDSEDVFYPSCPGVVAGKYDAGKHSFHNFTHEEIKQDVLSVKEKITAINPDIQLMLTVSPVPLTATATDKHVVVASQYSKSVLRSVAGSLEGEFDDVFYFPSYELITAPQRGDFRFLDNMRTVTHDAVKYVMSHFRLMLEKGADSATSTQQNAGQTADDETVCEEEMLEAVRKLDSSQPDEELESPQKLVLIGDSHLGKLSTALTTKGVGHAGGMIMNGSGFTKRKFAMCEEEYFVPLESADSRRIWSNALKHLKANDGQSTIVTNIGMQTHLTAARFLGWMKENRPTKLNSLTAQDIADFLQADQGMQLTLISNLVRAGNQVVMISDPPFSKHFEESKNISSIVFAYFATMEQILKTIGVTFINAALAFEQDWLNPDDYKSNVVFKDGSHDWYHGNEGYYAWLADKLQTTLKL